MSLTMLKWKSVPAVRPWVMTAGNALAGSVAFGMATVSSNAEAIANATPTRAPTAATLWKACSLIVLRPQRYRKETRYAVLQADGVHNLLGWGHHSRTF